MVTSCQEHIEIKNDNIISLSLIKDNMNISSLPADGNSSVTVRAEIPNNDINRNITLFTNNGTFSNGKKSIESVAFRVSSSGKYKYVEEDLTAPTIVGKALIYAKTENYYSDEKEIVFEEALATDITIKIDKLGIKRTYEEQIIITIIATSTNGIASAGQDITFTYKFNNNPFDEPAVIINSTKTNVSGTVTLILSAGNLDKEGVINVKAALTKNLSINDDINISVYDP